MLYRHLPLAPTVAAFATPSLMSKVPLTSSASPKVNAATAHLWETMRFPSTFKFRNTLCDDHFYFANLCQQKINDNQALKSELDALLACSHQLPSLSLGVENHSYCLLFVASHPLVAQEDLDKINSDTSIAHAHRGYIEGKFYCSPILLEITQKLLKILNTPPEDFKNHHPFDQLISSVKSDEDPFLSLDISRNLFHSTSDPFIHSKAAKLYRAALEAIRQKQCVAIGKCFENNPLYKQKEIVKRLKYTVDLLEAAPDPENLVYPLDIGQLDRPTHTFF